LNFRASESDKILSRLTRIEGLKYRYLETR
jgi:hypothetical protein